MATETHKGRGRSRGGREVGSVRALERGLSILEALAGEPDLSLTEVATRVNLPGSTTYRLLETLKRRRFVAHSPENGLYRVGPRAFEVGNAFVSGLRVHEAALPAMRALVAEVNETVNLAVADGRDAIYVGQVEGKQLVRMFTQIGTRTPLYCTGVGKVLLAWRSPDEIRSLLGPGPLRAYTPNTITDPERLLAELENVRTNGFALDNEEREVGVRCVAAPVRNRNGQVVAALSLSAPASRLGDDRVRELAPRVKATAHQISTWLGYSATGRP